jgi:hypothetical protein
MKASSIGIRVRGDHEDAVLTLFNDLDTDLVLPEGLSLR